MYSEVFCKVYNEFGWNYYPEAFGQALIRWLQVHGFSPKRSLDLGCGTGILCGLLSEHGIDASGTDLSESMIAIARKNFPHLTFETANIITSHIEKSFDLVTCTGDVLNHIPDLQDVAQVFHNVFRCLTPGGYFIFDILNEREIQPCEPFDCPFSDSIRAEFQITKDLNGTVNLKTRVYEQNEFRFEENIYEYLHDPQTICRMLAEAGFQSIQLSDRILPESSTSTTWYVIGRKV